MPRRLLTPLALALGACAPGTPSHPQDGFLDADAPADSADAGCTSTDPYCSSDHTQVLACDPASGSVTVLETCPSGEACVDGACIPVTCVPGTSQCVDDAHVRICRADGSGWDTMPCSERERCNEETGLCEPPCELRIFILLDQSGSMGGTEAPTKWDQAREAMATLMTGDGATDVEFGFGVFPTGGDCATDMVVIQPVPDATAEFVDEYFTTHSPSGNTPLVDALEFFVTDTSANLGDPAYHNALLLVSDGSDTCYIDCSEICGPFDFACITECESTEDELTNAALRAATGQLRDDLEIRTYVVGFGAGVSDEELSAIAANGGTVIGDWIAASDVEELAAAFQTVLEEMLECNPII